MKIVNSDTVVYTNQAVMNLMEELDKLREENIRLKKVLQFYANRRNFDFGSEKELRFCNSDDQADVFQPFGTKAKEALLFDIRNCLS